MPLRSVVVSIVAPVLVAGLGLAGGMWAGGGHDGRPALVAALDSLPRDTRTASFTDWSQIRRDVGVGSAATGGTRAALRDRAALADLSTRSVLGQSIEQMHDAYGWSAADLDWEAYGRAADGAVMVGRLSGSVSFASVRRHLVELGYVRDGRVWSATDGGASAELASTLAAIVLVPRSRLILAADRPAYAMTVLGTVERSQRSLLSVRPAADVAGRLLGADVALVRSGALTCAASAMPPGADIRAQADVAARRAGGLVTPSFSGRSLDVDRDAVMRFAWAFASPGVASDQLRVRSTLASGPFIGRVGRVEDSLGLAHAGVVGSVTLLRFDLDRDKGAYMTDGPLLFDACDR